MDPIDLARLRDFSDGTDAGMRELADMFMEHMADCAAALRPAVAEGRADVIRAEAHRASGTAGACGAQELAALLAALEAAGAEGRTGDAPGLMQRIDKETARVRAFFTVVFDAPPQAAGADSELPR